MSGSLYFMSGNKNEYIHLRTKLFPRPVEFLNTKFQIMGLATLGSVILAPAAFMFAPAFLAVLITLIAIASGVGYFGMASVRNKNYMKIKNPDERAIGNYWGFEKSAFRNFDNPTELWFQSASIINDYYELLKGLKAEAAGCVGADMIDSAIYACQQAYFEVIAKINRYKRFFSKDNAKSQARLEQEFAEVFEITKKVREAYENTLNYSIYAEATNETLTPGAAETVLDSVNETLEISIESLKQMDSYTGRNQLPASTLTVEEEIDQARQQYAQEMLDKQNRPQAVPVEQDEMPTEDYLSKDEIRAQFLRGQLDQKTA